jgi:hypothetical protein
MAPAPQDGIFGSTDAGEALRLFEALLPDLMRVLGPDHPDTLGTRKWINHWSRG